MATGSISGVSMPRPGQLVRAEDFDKLRITGDRTLPRHGLGVQIANRPGGSTVRALPPRGHRAKEAERPYQIIKYSRGGELRVRLTPGYHGDGTYGLTSYPTLNDRRLEDLDDDKLYPFFVVTETCWIFFKITMMDTAGVTTPGKIIKNEVIQQVDEVITNTNTEFYQRIGQVGVTTNEDGSRRIFMIRNFLSGSQYLYFNGSYLVSTAI